MATLTSFLEGAKLSSYEDGLKEYGIESLDDLMDLGEDEVAEAATSDEVNMKKLHQKKFIKAWKELKDSGGASNAAPAEAASYEPAPAQQAEEPAAANIDYGGDEEKGGDAVPPSHTLIPATFGDLTRENIPAKRSKADGLKGGAVIFYRDTDEKDEDGEAVQEFSVYDDLIVSNEFSQFVIGKGLVKADDDEDDEEDDGPLPEGWNQFVNEEGKVYYQNEETGEFQFHRPGAKKAAATSVMANCPGRHGLSQSTSAGHYCDTCATPLGMGSAMHSCRICDFDICQPCYEEQAERGKLGIPTPSVTFINQTYMDENGDIRKGEDGEPVTDTVNQLEFEYVLDENGEPVEDTVGWKDKVKRIDTELEEIAFQKPDEEEEHILYDYRYLLNEFAPEDNDFSVCCQIATLDADANAVIFSNPTMGLSLFITQDRKLALKTGNDMSKAHVFGTIQVFPGVPFYLTVVFDRRDNEEKAEDREDVLDITAYLDGIRVGRVNYEKAVNFSGEISIGGEVTTENIYGDDGEVAYVKSKIKHPFRGLIRDFEIYYDSLTPKQVFSMSQNEKNYSYKPPRLVSYKRESLVIPVKEEWICYNGPITGRMPEQIQQIKIEDKDDFCFSAWILMKGNRSKRGGVIVSKNTAVNGGMEFVVMPGTNTLGLHLGWDGYKNLGTTKLKTNKYYHVALNCERKRLEQQSVWTCYVNGKQDGSFTQKNMMESFGGDWFIGHRQQRLVAKKGQKEKTLFDGSIESFKMFKEPMLEAEIASLYAQAARDRHFRTGEKILYLTPRDTSIKRDSLKLTAKHTLLEWDAENRSSNESTKEEDSDKHETEFGCLEWKAGIFQSRNADKITVKITNASGDDQTVPVNEIIKTEENLCKKIPASDALKIYNLGGEVEGVDFKGKSFTLGIYEPGLLQYFVADSTFGQLTSLQKYQKHLMQGLIDNAEFDNKYVVNRLLHAAYKLLKDINGPKGKEHWKYFNEFILPWKVWAEKENWAAMVNVAGTLQEKYLNEQKALFKTLETTDYKIFKVEDKENKHKSLTNRQDCFDNGLTVEIEEGRVSEEVAIEYNKKIATMKLWGRCLLLDSLFQDFMKNLFEKEPAMEYVRGPIKTYERMMEKATEYRVVDKAPFPASFQICDVNRCSIKCKTLHEAAKCFHAVKDNLEIIRIKNRFHPNFPANETTGGYRDMLINVLFKDDKSKLSVIAEVQVHLIAYEEIKHKQHKYYKIKRAVDYLSLLRNYEARKFDDKKNKKDKKH